MKITKKKMAAALVAAATAAIILNETPEQTLVELHGYSEMAKAEKDSLKKKEWKLAKVNEEIVSMRDERSKHFKSENGKMRVVVTLRPQHYLDAEDGYYKEFDFTERDVDASVRNHPGRAGDTLVRIGNHVMFKKNSRPWDYRFVTADSASIEYTALHDETAITVETIPQWNGVKQNYILANESAATELGWLIDTNAVMQSADANSDIIFDYEGEFAFMVSAPIAWDAAGQNVIVNSWVDSDTLSYDVQLPENVSWPVTVDPSTTIRMVNVNASVTNTNASWAVARNATSGSIVENQLAVGQKANNVSRSFLTFEIPESVTALAGSLIVNGLTNQSTTAFFDLYLLDASSHNTVPTVADYNKFEGWAASGAYTGTVLNDTWNSVSFTSGANNIPLNSSGVDLITAASGDSLKIALISKNDYNNTGFTADEWLAFWWRVNESLSPRLTFTYTIPVAINEPTSFSLTASISSILTSWINNSANYESLLIMNSPEETGVVYADSPTDESKALTGLTPNTLYTFFARADSAGVKGDSNTDSLYTLSEAPTNLALAEEDSLHITLTFDLGANPDSTLFAVKNENWDNWYTATGDTTASEVWLTRAAWLAKTLLVPKDANVTITVKGKNGDGVETTSISESIVTNNHKTILIPFDNWVSKTANDATYGTARGESFSANITTEAGYAVGQNYSGGTYYVYRLAGEVAVPIEPDSLVTMSLKLNGSSDASTTDFNLEGRVGNWSSFDYSVYYVWDGARGTTTQHEGTNILSAWNSSSFIVGENSIDFSSSGEDSVKAYYGQTMPITVISSRDGSATVVTNSEISGFGSASLYMEYYDYDYAPSGVTITPLSATSIEVSWMDESSTETGFLVCAASDSTVMGSVTAANATADTITVIPNTLYQVIVKVDGGKKDGSFSAASSARYSWAALPVYKPMTTIISSSSIKIAPDSSESGNPPDTEWAIMMISTANDTGWVDLSQNPVVLNTNTLGLDDDWGWGTPFEWNVAGGGVLLTGLTKGHRYFRYAETRNHVSP